MAKSKKEFTFLIIALFCSSLAHAQKQALIEQIDSIDNLNDIIKIADSHSSKGGVKNALDVLNGQTAGVNVTSNGLDRMAMLNSVRVRGTTSITGGNDPLVLIDGVTSDVLTLSTIYPADIELPNLEKCHRNSDVWFTRSFGCHRGKDKERHWTRVSNLV